jgi:hypothetical protein
MAIDMPGSAFMFVWSKQSCGNADLAGSHSPPQFIECNRQVAYALAGGVIDSIGDRSRNAHNTNLAQPFDAEWVHHVIRLVDENDLDIATL